jgi:nicotinate-nucleotide pyrophosphorylase
MDRETRIRRWLENEIARLAIAAEVDPDGTLAASAATKVRAEGIVAGLEMADKFLSLTKDRKDVASMIRAAILAAKE